MTKQEIESRINELWNEQKRLEKDIVIYHEFDDIDEVIDIAHQIQAIVDERLELENSNPEIVPKEKEIKIGSVLEEMTNWGECYKVVGLGKTTVRLERVERDDKGNFKMDSEYNFTLETDGKPFSLRLRKDGSVYKKDRYGKRCKLQVVPL